MHGNSPDRVPIVTGTAEGSDAVPPIGIIIPTFNRTDVLLRCFAHLERQTWRDFEVVVVDDGSTDDTPRLLETYAAHTPLNLRYVRQRNTGPAGARNHAISLLRSPVFLMIGDDIMASPELVAKHLAFHQRHPAEAAFALGLTRWAEEGQTVSPFMRWLEQGTTQFAYADLLRGIPPTWRNFYTSNLSGKTEHLRGNRFNEGFTRNVMEDMELGYRLAQQGELDITFLPDALGEHIHPTDPGHSCRRMISVGYAVGEFHRLWPEQKPPVPSTPVARLRDRWLRRGTGLGLLRSATAALTRFWCPNPLLMRALVFHHEFGYRQWQSEAAAATQATK